MDIPKSFDTLVVDMDTPLYKIASAPHIQASWIDVESDNPLLKGCWENKTALKEFIVSQQLDVSPEDLQVTNQQLLLPKARENVKTAIKAFMSRAKEAVNADVALCLLGGKNNFRDSLPLPKKYKWNRDSSTKPLLLSFARDYVIQEWQTIVAEGVEADDLVAEYQYKGYKDVGSYVVAVIDKDANSTAGWVYNYDKESLTFIPQTLGSLAYSGGKLSGTGRKFLYAQWLMGDTTDGYKPTDWHPTATLGAAGAFKLLGDLETDEQCVTAIYKQYCQWYPDAVGTLCGFTTWEEKIVYMDVVDVMQLYLECCHMRRWSDDTPNVRKLLNKYKLELI